MNETYVTIFGNVVEDPYQRSEQAPVKFRLASTPAYVADDGMWRDGVTNFFDVVCWRKLGVHVAECVRRGDPVIVHGRLSIREWEGEKGRNRSVEIDAASVGFDLKRRKATVTERPIRTAREETPVTSLPEPRELSEAEEALAEPAA